MPVPAPGLEGVAGPLVEVALHHDAVGRLRVEVHDGVVVGHVLWPQDTVGISHRHRNTQDSPTVRGPTMAGPM